MKKYLLFFVVLLGCSKEEISEVDYFSGKLVKKGICMLYVIQVNDPDFPQDLIEKSWTDEFSNKKYKNVFALESVCDFPETIKKNDSFNFVINNDKENNCTVCLAYTPVPNKYISISVLD